MTRGGTLLSCVLLSACVQPYAGPPAAPVAGQALATQDQTALTEEQDRIARFRRLADMQGIQPPTVDQIMLPPGSVDFMKGPVPVVRVVFQEGVFFDFNSSTPRPEAMPILDLIAENMKHDVPDAALTVLGHTDAIGTDGYNLELSRRRAAAVMQALADRGVNPAQLTEVAIGKRQPIAPNATPAGRARNRRVEFLISPAFDANMAAVQQRVIPLNYLPVDGARRRIAAADVVRPASVAEVFKLKPDPDLARTTRPGGDVGLAPVGGLRLSPPTTELISQRTAEGVSPAPTMPVAPVELIPPANIEPATLQAQDNRPL